MRIAKPAYLLTGVASLLLFPVSAARATNADILRCKDTASPAARIACLEDALRAVRGDQPAAQPSGNVVQRNDTVSTAEAAVEPTTEPQTVEASVAKPSPDREPPQVSAESDASATRPAPIVKRSDDRDIGAEQLRRNRSREAIDADLARARDLRVARYSTVPYQRLVVHLENGQIWRQLRGDTQNVRASLRRNQTVDLEESSLGGYKLRLNEMRRTIRVERVR